MNAISTQSTSIHHHKQLKVHGAYRPPSLGSVILFKRPYGSYLLFIIISNKF